MMKGDIGPVEQVFLTMVKVLDEDTQDMILGQMHEKTNRLTAAHMAMLDEIDVYLVDPDRFGSQILIGRLHSILLEAIK